MRNGQASKVGHNPMPVTVTETATVAVTKTDSDSTLLAWPTRHVRMVKCVR